MLRIRTLIVLLFLSYLSFGQRGEFQGNKVIFENYPALDNQFKKYQVYELDLPAIDNFVSDSKDEYLIQLHLGKDNQWRIQLFPHDIRGEDYQMVVETENGQVVMPARDNMTYRGYLMNRGGGVVGLTIND